MKNESITPQLVKKSDYDAPCYFGQLFYCDHIGKAGEQKDIMARIALTVSERNEETPVKVSELIQLDWHNYHATLTFLTLAASVKITWDPTRKHQLKQWAIKK